MIKAKIFNIQKFSVHDGPGIRTLVFFQGCPLRCAWCANPEGLIFGQGGKDYSVPELMLELAKDAIFYEESGGGITLGGGEPCLQSEFASLLLQKAKSAPYGFHTAIETCAYVPWEKLSSLLPFLDLIYCDIKIMDEEKHKFWTGQSNRLILDNLKKMIQEFKGEIILRVPVIPGVNDDEENFLSLANFLGNKTLKIELLPYHLYGKNKYEQMKMIYKAPLEGFSPEAWSSFVQSTKETLDEYGIQTISSN